jgi:hypothetical protein
VVTARVVEVVVVVDSALVVTVLLSVSRNLRVSLLYEAYIVGMYSIVVVAAGTPNHSLQKVWIRAAGLLSKSI